MQLSKRQWFGLIVFIILIIAAYLVTVEPWKKSSRDLQTCMIPEGPPATIYTAWDDLTTGYPLTSTTDTIRSYTGFDLGYNEQFEQASWVAYVITGYDFFAMAPDQEIVEWSEGELDLVSWN